MKVTYSGTNSELSPTEKKKIEVKFGKLSKLIERNGEKTAHVVASKTRHLHKAEVTMHLRDHSLIGIGSNGSLFAALSAAIDHLEKQASKLSAKSRDSKKRSGKPVPRPATTAVAEPKEPRPQRIVKVTGHERRKPMTVEEAIMEMGNRTHLVFRGTDSDRTTVIVRRPDGDIDLIEG